MPNYTVVDEARDLIKPYVDTGDSAQESLTRSTVGFTGKNEAFSQENNAVIAHIKNGKSYKVRWTGSATVTLTKDTSSGTQVATGSTSPLSFTADADYDLYFGSSADVIEIMVWDARIKDSTYEPYHASVADLVGDIQEVIPSGASSSNKLTAKSDVVSWDDYAESGAVNVLPNTATTTTVETVVFTVDADGIVTVNGTPTTGKNAALYLYNGNAINVAGLKLIGCPVGGSDNSYSVNVRYSDGTWAEREYGAGIILEKDVNAVVIVIYDGYTANNLEFKPMIAPASYTGDYVPFAMTNRELTERVSLEDITDTVTKESSNVQNLLVLKYGKLVFVNFRYDQAITAKTLVLSNLPQAATTISGKATDNTNYIIRTDVGAVIGIDDGRIFITGTKNSTRVDFISIQYFAK